MKTIKDRIREKLNTKKVVEGSGLAIGDRIVLIIPTISPRYKDGEVLTVVDPNYDVVMGNQLILARGSAGDIALTQDMYKPL